MRKSRTICENEQGFDNISYDVRSSLADDFYANSVVSNLIHVRHIVPEIFLDTGTSVGHGNLQGLGLGKIEL